MIANFDVIFEPDNLKMFVEGLWVTLKLLVISLVAGSVLTLPLTLMRVSSKPWLRWPVWLFTYVLRGTPLLIQVFFIYYGLAQLSWIQERWNEIWPWTWFKEPFFCAAFAFMLNTSAYTVEMLAGAIKEMPSGEIEAAKSAGFSKWSMMFRLVLPSALRRILPGYGNEVVMMLHATSLASIVPSLYDLTNAANTIYKTYYLMFAPYITIAILYSILTYSLIYIFKRLEDRYLAYLRPREH